MVRVWVGLWSTSFVYLLLWSCSISVWGAQIGCLGQHKTNISILCTGCGVEKTFSNKNSQVSDAATCQNWLSIKVQKTMRSYGDKVRTWICRCGPFATKMEFWLGIGWTVLPIREHWNDHKETRTDVLTRTHLPFNEPKDFDLVQNISTRTEHLSLRNSVHRNGTSVQCCTSHKHE